MKSTLTGPYPRVGSECGDRLRRELNKLYESTGNAVLVQSLKRDLTREIVGEVISAGIDLPNYGLIDVYDELSWPLENFDGVEFGGMKKIFHTNTHFRQAIVNGEVQKNRSLLSDLYGTALEIHPTVKVEFPGPYTLARHSVLGRDCPYASLGDLAEAYAKSFREELLELVGVPLVQFNEPSMIVLGARSDDIEIVPELYSKMLNGLDISVAVSTFYGRYSSHVLEMLLSLPVDSIGLDFVWNPQLGELLRNISCDKEICIGMIDSGDRGYIELEDVSTILERLKALKGCVDLDRSFLSSNATLEHLSRDYARRKVALIGEISRRVNR